MIDEEYVSRIKLATELATKKITSIHRKSKDSSDNENESYEYESLFRSMIFHELMLLGRYFGDVQMSNPIKRDKGILIHKKPDIWIENTESGESYILEIKMIKHHEKNRIIDQINADRKNSVLEDIKKLSGAMREESLQVKGIIALSYQSPNFAGDEDPVDIMDNEIRKIVKRIKPPGDFMFVLCSEDFCRVLKAGEILKK